MEALEMKCLSLLSNSVYACTCIMTTVGPEGVRYSENFGILKLVLWATCSTIMILYWLFYKVFGVRYTAF